MGTDPSRKTPAARCGEHVDGPSDRNVEGNLIKELGEDGSSLVAGPRVVRRVKIRKNRPEPPNCSHLVDAVDHY